MNNILKVAVLLTAVDQMSNSVQNAVNKSQNSLSRFNSSLGISNTSIGLAAAGLIEEGVRRSITAYASLQDAQLDLQSVMLREGNKLNTEEFSQLNKLAVELGNKLPGTTEDFERMFAVMIKSGADAKQIMGGAGKAAAYLAITTDQSYTDMARSVLKFKHAMGVEGEDLVKFMDIIARTKNLDVEIGEMQFAFGRSAGALKTLGLQGLESSKSLSALFAMLIQNGQTGETVGTGFTTLTRTLTDKSKIDAFNQSIAKYGLNLQFIDKNGRFTIENMVNQFSKLNKIKDLGERSTILKGLFGGGNDQSIAETIIFEGNKGYNERIRLMAEQADMMDKNNLKLSGQVSKWEAMMGTIQNVFAEFGKSNASETDRILDNLNSAFSSFQEWQTRHPIKTKVIFQSIISPLWASNTIGKQLSDWAAPFRAEMRSIFSTWGQAFYELGHYSVKQLGKAFRGTGWFLTELFEAGKRMVEWIAKGIVAGYHYVTNSISKLATQIREYFPFSPAKKGALSDIHKTKLVETVANSIKPQPIINALKSLAPAYAPARLQAIGANNGSPVTIHYNPTITISGGNVDSFKKQLKDNAEDIKRIIDDALRNKERTRF